MERTKLKHARKLGYTDWESFAQSRDGEELAIHEDIVMYTRYPNKSAGTRVVNRDKVAYATSTRLECLRVLRNLLRLGEPIFCQTYERLVRGNCEYPYLYFEDDQWTGINHLEFWDYKEYGDKWRRYKKELKLI